MSAIFSKVLKSLRCEHDISQKELATELNVSQASVNRWENGFEPSMEKLECIAAYFGVTMDKLFGEQKSPLEHKKSGDEKELYATIEKLSKANQLKVLGYSKGLLEWQMHDSNAKKS